MGLWHVTTEGDQEGRTTRDLGTHEGYFDEVAFKLGDQAFYGLRMEYVDPKQKINHSCEVTKVNVSFDVCTDTWNLSPNERVKVFQKFLYNRDVMVEPSNFYACALLLNGKDPASLSRKEAETKRQAALAKLNDEDKKALGLK